MLRSPRQPECRDGPQSTPGRYSYRWPVKPFSQQHPVRGFFGDPRISNHGESHQFHFGVDISAPNDTRVYATLSGTAYIHALHSTTIEVVGENGVEFSYWHVVPSIRSGQRVTAYETVIGRIEEPYGHVHFSEKLDGRYLNPLRPGAMGPFVDDTRPTVRSVVSRDDMLVAETYDETPLAVPRPWFDLPVMPALAGLGGARSCSTPAAASRSAGAPRPTSGSRSHPRPSSTIGGLRERPRTTCARPVGTRSSSRTRSTSRAGRYQVEVAVRDTRGNGSVHRFPLDLSGS